MREGGMEGEREGEREGGREGEREGGRYSVKIQVIQKSCVMICKW